MAPPYWTRFAAAVAVLTVALLALTYGSARFLASAGAAADAEPSSGADHPGTAPRLPSGVALQANLAVTHGLLAVALVSLAWYAAVPFGALGIGVPSAGGVGVGLGLGAVLYVGSETAAALADRLGIDYDERLRELLAPDRPVEWVVLLAVALPVVAVAEELLFRGVLVGALGAGFGLPAPALVVGSSVLFGLGHTAQGRVGVGVTAALGLVLGGAFVWTGSLAVVVVAHYVVDVLEFAVREGLLG